MCMHPPNLDEKFSFFGKSLFSPTEVDKGFSLGKKLRLFLNSHTANTMKFLLLKAPCMGLCNSKSVNCFQRRLLSLLLLFVGVGD